MGTVGVGLGLQCIRVVVLKVTAVARSTGRNIVAIIKHPTSQVSRVETHSPRPFVEQCAAGARPNRTRPTNGHAPVTTFAVRTSRVHQLDGAKKDKQAFK